MTCPNEQVNRLSEVLLNIYFNFIPNKVKTIRPRQAPWITQAVKNFLRKKNRAYKIFVRNGRPDDKLEGVQKMTSEDARLIEEAKRNYFLKAGKTLANPGTSSKTYWTLMNTVLNKIKIPMIPPLLENGLFATDFAEKAQIFNDYFILQCTNINTGSEIPLSTHILYHTNYLTLINHVSAQETQQSTSYSQYHIRYLKHQTVILLWMFAPFTLTFLRHLVAFGTMVYFINSNDVVSQDNFYF